MENAKCTADPTDFAWGLWNMFLQKKRISDAWNVKLSRDRIVFNTSISVLKFFILGLTYLKIPPMELYSTILLIVLSFSRIDLRNPECHTGWSDSNQNYGYHRWMGDFTHRDFWTFNPEGKLISLQWSNTHRSFGYACSTTVYRSWGETMTNQINRRKGKRIEYFGNSRMVITPDNSIMQASRMD